MRGKRFVSSIKHQWVYFCHTHSKNMFYLTVVNKSLILLIPLTWMVSDDRSHEEILDVQMLELLNSTSHMKSSPHLLLTHVRLFLFLTITLSSDPILAKTDWFVFLWSGSPKKKHETWFLTNFINIINFRITACNDDIL